jgi:hypothetical protein
MICRRCGTALPIGALFCHCCAFTGPELSWAAAAVSTEPVRRGELPPAATPGAIVLDEVRVQV